MTSLNDTFYDCLTQSKYDEFSKNVSSNENVYSKNNNVSNTYNCITNCFVNLFTFFKKNNKDKDKDKKNKNTNTKIIINSEGNNLEYVAFQ